MRHFGPSYYSFNVGAGTTSCCRTCCTTAPAYRLGYIDDRQLRWLEADLALVEPGRLVVLFMHISLEEPPVGAGRQEGAVADGLSTIGRPSTNA